MIAMDPASTELQCGRQPEKKVRKASIISGNPRSATKTREEKWLLSGKSWSITTRLSPLKTGWPRKIGRLEVSPRRLQNKVQLVGDDLFVTNANAWRKGLN